MRNRYKVAAFIFSLIFLVFLPHDNLLNVESAFKGKTVLESSKKQEQKVQAAQTTQQPIQDISAKTDKMVSDAKNILEQNSFYSLSVYDLKRNQFYGLNDTTSHHAASVMKLLVATSVIRKIESGQLNFDQPLGAGTVGYQLQQLVNQSNNDSWDFFNNILGFQGEQDTANQLGLTNIDVFHNSMSAKGVSELLLKLYWAEAVNQKDRDLLFSYMQNTETEDRITAIVPKNVQVYHKTGSFNGEVHDAAIVAHPKNPFILVIFTDDESGQVNTTKTVQDAARVVYKYFDSL